VADLVADGPTIINHLVDILKLSAATGGIIWYLSSRLTKTEKTVEANDAASLGRSSLIKEEIKTLRSEITNEIGKLDGKLDKMDIKIAGEIRDVNNKIESKIEVLDLKLRNMSESSDRKYVELEKQLTRYQDEVDGRIASIELEVKTNGTKEPVKAARKRSSAVK